MKGQRGLAMISVLLIMALLMLLAAGMLRSQRLLVHGVSQQVQYQQLRQWALVGERWAAGVLAIPTGDEQRRIHQGQRWAHAAFPATTEQVVLTVRIEDLAARLNLNVVLRDSQREPVVAQRWHALLAQLHLQMPALEAAPALQHLSQLRLVSGIDASMLRQLRSRLAVLPVSQGLNVNTASSQTLQLLGMSSVTADNLVRQRPAQGYGSVQAFLDDPLVDGLGIAGHGLSVTSQWFRVTVLAVRGDARLMLQSDFHRDGISGATQLHQRELVSPLDSDFSL